MIPAREEGRVDDRLLQAAGAVLRQGLVSSNRRMNSRNVICSIHLDRVVDAAGPERIPDPVDLAS